MKQSEETRWIIRFIILWFVFMAVMLVIVMLDRWNVVKAQPGNSNYDYTSDLHRDCLREGLASVSTFGEPLCEIVKVERLTKAQALTRKLQYRAVGWGKLFPADEDGYYIAKSGEFIPQSWSVPSPDGNFHRCTYPLNSYWDAKADHWKVRRSESTRDGLPTTKCFWRPK